MALTKPYFDYIRAFDATLVEKNVIVNVLGGDNINYVYIEIYNNQTNNRIYRQFSNVSDVGGESIRSFNISIPSSAGLKNNQIYSIFAYTGNDTTTSPMSSPSLFFCYSRPSLSINITNKTSFGAVNSSKASIMLDYDNSASPNALFGKARITLTKNVNGTESSLVSSVDNIFTLNNPIILDGLIPNVDSSGNPLPGPAVSYDIIVDWETSQGMEASAVLLGFNCYYEQSTDSAVFVANNICEEGYIEIVYTFENNNTPDKDLDSFLIEVKEENQNEWVVLADYSNTSNRRKIQYTIIDRLRRNNVVYDYRITPTLKDGSVGTVNTSSVLSSFYGAYICDQSTMYNILNEYSFTGYSRVQKSIKYEPFGSKYPFISYNSTTNYRQGSTSAILMAPTSNSYIDRFAQEELLMSFNNWLINQSPKVIKDFNGRYIVVATDGNVSISPYSELGNGLATDEFSWVEISDPSCKGLYDAGVEISNNDIFKKEENLISLILYPNASLEEDKYVAELNISGENLKYKENQGVWNDVSASGVLGGSSLSSQDPIYYDIAGDITSIENVGTFFSGGITIQGGMEILKYGDAPLTITNGDISDGFNGQGIFNKKMTSDIEIGENVIGWDTLGLTGDISNYSLKWLNKNATDIGGQKNSGFKNATLVNDLYVIDNVVMGYNITDFAQPIVIPSNIVNLSSKLFFRESSLQSITLNEGLTNISRLCFANTKKLKELSIPSTVSYIGMQAFAASATDYGLTSVTFNQSKNFNVVLPKAGKQSGMFYTKNNRSMVVNTDNITIAKYDYYADNISATIKHLDGSDWNKVSTPILSYSNNVLSISGSDADTYEIFSTMGGENKTIFTTSTSIKLLTLWNGSILTDGSSVSFRVRGMKDDVSYISSDVSLVSGSFVSPIVLTIDSDYVLSITGITANNYEISCDTSQTITTTDSTINIINSFNQITFESGKEYTITVVANKQGQASQKKSIKFTYEPAEV